MLQTLDPGGLGVARDGFRSVAGCFAVAQHESGGGGPVSEIRSSVIRACFVLRN